MMNMDGDLGRHLTVGNYILDQGEIPLRDVFSHTMAGEPITPHEWLSQVLFALAERLLGLDGVVLLTALVIPSAFWLVFKRAAEGGRSVLPALLVIILAIAASSLHWLTRPHVFTFLLLAVWMLALDDLRRGRLKHWFLLPMLMLAWANLHGAFIAGFVTWFLYGAGLAWDAWRKRLPQGEELPLKFWRFYLLGGGSALAASLFNPSGVGLWLTSVGYLGNSYLVSHTAEYLPPNFSDPFTWPFLLMIALLVVVLILNIKRTPAYHFVPAIAWMGMALVSMRHIPLFSIVTAPLLAQDLAGMLHSPRKRRTRRSRLKDMDGRLAQVNSNLKGFILPFISILIVAAGFLGGGRFDAARAGNDFDPAVFPVAAVDWLEEHPRDGEMFNYFPWGGYLLYRGFPGLRVFIDGQTDFYGEVLTRQYEQVLDTADGWEEVLEEYDVTWVILPPDELLVQVLQTGLNWQMMYRDDTAVILSE